MRRKETDIDGGDIIPDDPDPDDPPVPERASMNIALSGSWESDESIAASVTFTNTGSSNIEVPSFTLQVISCDDRNQLTETEVEEEYTFSGFTLTLVQPQTRSHVLQFSPEEGKYYFVRFVMDGQWLPDVVYNNVRDYYVGVIDNSYDLKITPAAEWDSEAQQIDYSVTWKNQATKSCKITDAVIRLEKFASPYNTPASRPGEVIGEVELEPFLLLGGEQLVNGTGTEVAEYDDSCGYWVVVRLKNGELAAYSRVNTDNFPYVDPMGGGGTYITPAGRELNNDAPVGNTTIAKENTIEAYDHIYRIDYDAEADEFTMVKGQYPNGTYETDKALFDGDLGFSPNNPIESVVYQETDDINKIYWVDGKNVLRFMNFTASLSEIGTWTNTSFDSNRALIFNAYGIIEKDNGGNNRPNGVVQYLLTYFNKYGQETGYAWVSDLVYLSPAGTGGAADGTNANRISIKFYHLDTRFTHFRVYSVFRSSVDGAAVSYLVSEQETSSDMVEVVDDGAHLTLQDASRLLYLGSQPVIAETMVAKDQTLFLGDLRSIGRGDYKNIETAIKSSMFTDYSKGIGKVEFIYSNDDIYAAHDVQYVANSGIYPYENQLVYSSSEILSFKGGEKYRFALKFQLEDGTETDAFWIGDSENTLYPVIDANNQVIKRVIAQCVIPQEVLNVLPDTFATVRLMMAEATYADRAVKAQGVVNPTMFNVWERYSQRLYSVPSWISRPRNSMCANKHFDPVANATSTAGEIQCNYWKSDNNATPYFQYKGLSSGNPTYVDELEGMTDFDLIKIVYTINYPSAYSQAMTAMGLNPLVADPIVGTVGATMGVIALATRAKVTCKVEAHIILAKILDSSQENRTAIIEEIKNKKFVNIQLDELTETPYSSGDDIRSGWKAKTYRSDDGRVDRYRITAGVVTAQGSAFASVKTAASKAYDELRQQLVEKYCIPSQYIVTYKTSTRVGFEDWAKHDVHSQQFGLGEHFNNPYNYFLDIDLTDASLPYRDTKAALNAPVAWSFTADFDPVSVSGERTAAYYKRHLMFVDENTITLDSPELMYNQIMLDKAEYKFRLVGVAKMTSVMSDYTIDATPSAVPGASVDRESFSGTIHNRNKNIHGILTWPLWKDYGLQPKDVLKISEKDIDQRGSEDYMLSNSVVRYWMYMWNHSGVIGGYVPTKDEDEDGKDISKDVDYNPATLKEKTFANLHFGYETVYSTTPFDMPVSSLRQVNEFSDTYNIKVGDDIKYYSNKVQLPLTMPGLLKYPLLYSLARPDTTISDISAGEEDVFLYSNAPIMLEYRTNTHAVIALPTEEERSDSNHVFSTYRQTILPVIDFPGTEDDESSTSQISNPDLSGPLIPWITTRPGSALKFREYKTDQGIWEFEQNEDEGATQLRADDQYLFIGEIYQDYSENDTRYGGVSKAAIANCRFIPAGPQYPVSMKLPVGAEFTIYGNQGDTYFQRWDGLRTMPFSNGAENKVIDITSVMLETHINLDGRSDMQRAIPELASIDVAQYGQINPVYSQKNNFIVRRDMDETFNNDSYRASVTWTLPKSNMAFVDEWSHITLSSSLDLDANQGKCRALRRFKNEIIAFQDRGISNILFNSRTQLATNEGVPVEIANSGKVEGKHYLTTKYGVTNKWSIVEGNAGVYFVDDINKSFCVANLNQRGQLAVDNISAKLGFQKWFADSNDIESWKPLKFNNIVSFFDRVHGDVYLSKSGGESEYPTLVFNELLGTFTSFFSYNRVPMMANVENRFVSFFEHKLWRQNEGFYGDFYGVNKPFSVRYRVTPEPYGDKVWTNVEYRADFYKNLDGMANAIIPESHFAEADENENYLPDETFDSMRFWNEYQTTGDVTKKPIKKFRIWRLAIPRAIKLKNDDTNRYGLDRIRNPWLNLQFTKLVPDDLARLEEYRKNLMQLHDIIVTYYE